MRKVPRRAKARWQPASIQFLSNRFNAPGFVGRFNVAPVLNPPVETITQGLLLRYKPPNLDVLPLYVVLTRRGFMLPSGNR